MGVTAENDYLSFCDKKSLYKYVTDIDFHF